MACLKKHFILRPGDVSSSPLDARLTWLHFLDTYKQEWSILFDCNRSMILLHFKQISVSGVVRLWSHFRIKHQFFNLMIYANVYVMFIMYTFSISPLSSLPWREASRSVGGLSNHWLIVGARGIWLVFQSCCLQWHDYDIPMSDNHYQRYIENLLQYDESSKQDKTM